LSRQSFRTSLPLGAAALVLALGLGGVALAQHSTGSATVNVTILDGKLKVSPLTFTSGKVTLVVTNKGKQSHGLAIMGKGLGAKRTPTLASGKSAKLTVTVGAGMYHVWDPVTSSMSHATMLTARAATSSSGGTSSGGAYGGSSSGTGSGIGGGTTGSGTATTPDDPCAGHMM
jgi:hypothetical protein